MARERKYHAKVALHISPDETPRMAVLEEKFKGKDTWAHPYYRRSQCETDKELRERATTDLLRIATIGENPSFRPGRDIFDREVIPSDFSGTMIFEILGHSRHSTGYIEISRAPYLLQMNL